MVQGATEALARLPRASKSQIRASILKDQEITLAQIRQAKSVIVDIQSPFSTKNNFFFWGQVKISFGQVFWLNLYLTRLDGQVVIKTCCSCMQILSKSTNSYYKNFYQGASKVNSLSLQI